MVIAHLMDIQGYETITCTQGGCFLQEWGWGWTRPSIHPMMVLLTVVSMLLRRQHHPCSQLDWGLCNLHCWYFYYHYHGDMDLSKTPLLNENSTHVSTVSLGRDKIEDCHKLAGGFVDSGGCGCWVLAGKWQQKRGSWQWYRLCVKATWQGSDGYNVVLYKSSTVLIYRIIHNINRLMAGVIL